jgi:hypothetical protein
MRLVAPLVVDFSASRRLVVDYFAYTARPGASARRAARRVDRRAARRRLLRLAQACCRLLHLHRVSGCLGTSRGSSLVIDYSSGCLSTSRGSSLVVDYFAYGLPFVVHVVLQGGEWVFHLGEIG